MQERDGKKKGQTDRQTDDKGGSEKEGDEVEQEADRRRWERGGKMKGKYR